jgi:hypothetical protein
MSDPTIYGLVGHKIAKASSAAVLGNCVDSTPQFAPRQQALFQDGINLYQAIYVYCGQTVSGSAYVQIDTGGTASVTASGYVALMSAGLQALPGQYIWVRSSVIPSGFVAN